MRKTIILILAILILQLNFSCKANYSTTELENNFTPEQIADLNKISDFFKDQICKNRDSDLRSCFEQIPHDSLQASGNSFWTNINFEKQNELYDQISESTFSEIWMFSNATYYPSEIKAKSLSAVATGKYQKFLADLGKRNHRIAEYAKRIQASGDFSGFDFNYREILQDRKSFDLKDPNIQLILAIHYLSMNDHDTRNKELMRPARPGF